MKLVRVFPGGSSSSIAVSWSFVVEKDGKILKQDSGSAPEDQEIENRRTLGEIFGVMKAIEYCKKNNYIAEFHVGNLGLIHWVSDILKSGHPLWGANNPFNKRYRQFIARNRESVVSINDVKAGSGGEYSELADKLAKGVLGL